MSDKALLDDIDYWNTDRFSAMGATPVIVIDVGDSQFPVVHVQAVIIGVDRTGTMPVIDAEAFDLLLTIAVGAPAPWVSVLPDRLDAELERLVESVRARPVAATTLCSVLRIGEHLSFDDGLKIESMAYSALLGGAEFAGWRATQPHQAVAEQSDPMVVVDRESDSVTLTINHPQAQNAMTAAMRDALYAALANVLDDPTAPQLILRGAGKCFSTGGAPGEFGTATDLAQAHVVRTLRSCAALLNRLGDRASVHLQGACIGSGLEIPAAAAHRFATPDTWFQLPELHMGLIPGAGGTVSVRRAIGRHRTAWMLLSGKRISAKLALIWGLIDEIVP